MSATFKLDDIVKFVKEYKYGDSVCKAGLTGRIVYSASSTKTGDNRTEAVERHDNKQIVRSIPIAYIQHV